MNFAISNILFSIAMLCFGTWDCYTSLTNRDKGMWNDKISYGVIELISMLLALETILIYCKLQNLVFTDG